MPGDKSKPHPQNSDTEETLTFPAAMAQEAFYYLSQLNPKLSAFNVAMRFRLEGALNVGLLQRAFNTVVERHEILRTHFEENDGVLLQVVVPMRKVFLEVSDLSHLSAATTQAPELERIGLMEAQEPFDLGQSPLLRVRLVRLSAEEHILHVTLHHAVCDGWSLGLLAGELTALYEAFSQDKPSPLAPLEIQYPDFAVWQNKFLTGSEMLPQMDYWKERLRGLTELDLPTDHPRPAVKRWRGDIVSRLLPVELTKRLEALAQENDATLFHAFLAAFKILLHRYTGVNDIAIGTPVAGRNRAELEPLIGTFINTLILRTDFSGDPDFYHILRQVRDRAVEAMEHQDLPFESIVRELRPERDSARNPLFQINFTHQRSFVKPLTFAGIKLTGIPSVSPGAIFDLHLFMVERENTWLASCDFSTDLFDRSTAQRLLIHFRQLLESIVSFPGLPIAQLPMLDDEETRQVLRSWNETAQEYEREVGVHEVFARIADEYAGKKAVRCGKQALTYRELAHRSDQIAATLQSLGVQAGDLVGVCLERSTDMVAALLGIFKAGAAYVPLDPALPGARMGFMMEDAKLRTLLTHCSLLSILPDHQAQILLLDQPLSEVPGGFQAHLGGREHPAYVTFTSGSTGRPKGVCIPHRALMNFLSSMRREPGLEPADVLFSVTTLSFDISGLEIFLPLTTGATVVIAPGPIVADGHLLRQELENSGATVMQATPATWRLLIEAGWAGHPELKILIGGEAVPRELVNQLVPRCASIWNVYGPTETTIWSTVTRLEAGEGPVPIGHPIDNTQVYVVNRALQLQPVSVPGELLIGGDGLALGYLHRPDFTADRFIPNPFAGAPSSRLYRTGDLARWCADGSLECLGRLDLQLKIRGHRIEPGEIEALLEAHPRVAQAVVVATENGTSDASLAAFIIPKSTTGSNTLVESLREELCLHLPAYMIPTAWVLEEKFPLTPNGKIDRLALSKRDCSLDENPAGHVFVAPITETEKLLAGIWCDLLGMKSVSREDNFFDLGGHSLMALRLFSRIRRHFNLPLPLATLLNAPTVARLADRIDVEKSLGQRNADEDHHAILAAVQTEGHLTPFFCVHGADGGVLFYRQLAEHLTLDRPLMAIEASSLWAGGTVRDESIESVAARYVSVLLKHLPQGPFLLGGYSFGGVVAYEMACQLTGAGKRVELLALFDTINPAFQTFSRLDRISRIWNQNKGLGLAGRMLKLAAFFRDRLASRFSGEFFAAKNNHPELPNEELYKAHLRAMESYHPKPYDGRLTLFRTDDRDQTFQVPVDYGWGPLVAELDMIFVPGHHSTLFNEENVALLGTKLRHTLQSLPV